MSGWVQLIWVIPYYLPESYLQKMVNIICESDGHCPYQYYCDPKDHCLHDPVFPLTLYPILIYCIFPFASAICNVSGNSFGEFKVLLLMDLLDYTESAATVMCYPLTVGTALFNFITLLPRRHPNKNTSLVDFNIVMIIIPSVLFGSTIGGLTNKFIPPIIADALIIGILGAFSIKFFLRLYNFKKEEKKERESELEKVRKEIEIKQFDEQTANNMRKSQLKKGLIQDKKGEQRIQIEIVDEPQVKSLKIMINPYQDQLDKQLKYQQSYHVPHILATCVIFAVFETLSFLAQGKIINFSICSTYYVIGMVSLTVVYLAFVVIMYQYTKRKMEYYRKIQYEYEIKLDSMKFFVTIAVASFLGGFNGGVFGLGSSTTMIFALLYLQIEPMVVTATVGFQVVFSGLGSLCQAFATNQISFAVAGFFFLITFILGGALSFIALRFVRRMNKNKVNQVLMAILGALTGGSVFALVANIVLSYHNFGATYMISSPFEC